VDTFVIKIKFGGLGDHLFYSHLPRIAKEYGGARRVLVSNLSEYRHPDYKRLVWEANPYVDGFCDDDAPYPEGFGSVPEGMNLLDYLMIRRGLDDGKRFHEPELHFQPAKIDALADATIYDPNYVSNVGVFEAQHIDRYFARNRIKPDFMLLPRGKGIPAQQYGAVLETKNLEHYCSVMISTRRFICLTSGGATLAAALGRPAICLYGEGQLKMFHHSRLHRYINVNPPPLSDRAKALAFRLGRAVRRRVPGLGRGEN
jgi:hypothetical protein